MAKSASSTSTPAPVIALISEDFPALVYPAMAIWGIVDALRCDRFTSRAVFIPESSFRNFAISERSLRRSASIFVSPGPRKPTPPLDPARPPAWRESAPPQPRTRVIRYSICARDTCALPSFDFACWAKISRMSMVRSMTFTSRAFSSAIICPGLSSPSQMTVSEPVAATMSFSSWTFPEPM